MRLPEPVVHRLEMLLCNVCPGIELTVCDGNEPGQCAFYLRRDGRNSHVLWPTPQLPRRDKDRLIDVLCAKALELAPKKMWPVCDSRRISVLKRYGSQKRAKGYRH